MTAITNTEWLNSNSLRSYPIGDTATNMATNGMHLSPRILVDAVITCPASPSGVYNYFISNIALTKEVVVFTLSKQDGSVIELVSTIVVDVLMHKPNTAYQVVGVGSYSDVVGSIVVGDLTDIELDMPYGVYMFDQDATYFALRCINPSLRQVRSIKVIDAFGSTAGELFGDVRIVNGDNIALSYVPAKDGKPHGIRITAKANALSQEADDCNQIIEKKGTPIQSINGVRPDAEGNIQITATEPCTEIVTTATGLSIQDKCTTPCCGCTELEYIQANITLLQHSITELERRADQLKGKQAELNVKLNMV